MRSPSGTERSGSEPRLLDPPQAMTPSSENPSIKGNREKKEGMRMRKGITSALVSHKITKPDTRHMCRNARLFVTPCPLIAS